MWSMGTQPGTPLIPTPISLTDLVSMAEAQGLAVRWVPCTPHRGRYYRDRSEIWIQPGMTTRLTRSILAHELGHAHRGDAGPCAECGERAAWAYAARLLVSPEAYRDAEQTVGSDICSLALELGVTSEVILAWRECRQASPRPAR